MTHYRHDPDDSTSLSDNFVFEVYVDRQGIVWAGTQNGLNRLDPQTGRITRYRADPEDSTTLSQDFVAAINEDAAGNLWVGTGNGLNLLNHDTNSFTRFLYETQLQRPNDRMPPSTVMDIRPDRRNQNVLWLAGGSGIVKFNTSTGAHSSHIPEGGEEDMAALAFDPNQPEVIWATSDGGGLVRFDSRTETFTVFRHDRNDPASVGHDALFALHADRSGMMWVGSQQQSGVDKFDPSAGGFANYRHLGGDPSSLHPGNVWGVYVPPSRPYEIWSIHQDDPPRSRDRLNRIDRRTGEVTQFVHDPSNPRSLGQGQICVIHEDKAGRLWVATQGGGLNLFERDRATFRRFTTTDDPTSISSNQVMAIEDDLEGHLWIGTIGGGLNRMDPDRPGVFERIDGSPADSTGLLGRHILTRAIAVAPDGHVWVGTNAGLNRIDVGSGSLVRYDMDANDSTALMPGNVTHVYVDQTGAIWAATFAGGSHTLHRLDPETDTMVRYRHDPTAHVSLSDLRIEVIHERPEEPGILWIGSPTGGLTRLDAEKGTVRHYTEEDGLANNFVYGILNDDEGKLWLSTNNGLSRFDPETETFRNFDVDDGHQSKEFNSHAFHRAATGLMLFGGIKGVTAFDPAGIQPNLVPPEVLLTNFRLFNKTVMPGSGSVLEAPLAETKEIRLAHWQKTLTFDFIGLHFRNPEKNQYAYMLEGFDDDWVMAGTQRSATYTNLDPGRYTFRVKAANSDGVWNERGAEMPLIIAPPFWQTVWFRILAVLAVAGLGFTFYRARVRHIQEHNRQLESQVAQRTAELRSKNEQLEKSHAIVAAINAETVFESLLNAVLEQTRVIPGVEKASALVYDKEADAYVAKASIGWDVARLAGIRLSADQAHARYVENALEVEQDIFLERNVAERPGSEALKKLGMPASLLVMRVRSADRIEGYLVFDNMSDRDAFDEQDLNLLISLREHIRSAFVKTRLLEDLQRSIASLRATQAQLVQSEKMASLGQLTAGIAHEIKNPLNFINNFAALCDELADELLEEIGKNEKRRVGDVADELEPILRDLKTNASKIQEHGRRADGIVRSMLQHSRGKSGERQPTNINGLLEEYVNLAYHGMRAQQPDFNVAIDRDFDGSVNTLEVIPQELGRVFINLLNNAFYAVHEKALELNGKYVPRVTVKMRRRNGNIEVRIADNGPGIPEAIRRRIFEPFFTTKPTGDGTGLGLSLSYDIVTQGHGGTIEVESEQNEGTTFSITLPAGRFDT